jgi:hypothetical protein
MRKFFGPALSPLPFALSLVGALFFAPCSVAEAQPETKIFRIGYLDAAPSGSAPLMEAFRQSMAKLGWVEGKISSLSIDS